MEERRDMQRVGRKVTNSLGSRDNLERVESHGLHVYVLLLVLSLIGWVMQMIYKMQIILCTPHKLMEG